ncbi:MAG: cytochrome c oxidase subunit 3 family protein [Bdellovibrionales bacterium]
MSTASHSDSSHHVAHHYNDAEHEYNTSKFGLWLFLCTEIVMFGGLFVGYAIYHHMYPELFKAGSLFLDWKMGALNTVVLLISSFTMALSIYYAQINQKKKVLINLYITLICAGIFMVVKYFEYTHKIHLGLLPGKLFHYAGSEEFGAVTVANLPLYFSFYFCMTGLHGSHVLAGMGFIVWLIVRAHRGDFGPKYFTPLECVGLFWHLVDLIWIYLFPLLYLVG